MIALRVDPDAADPPFEQVRRQVATAVADGTLAPGHPLPTVRGLAADLGLAVNTVARAYRELEADGVVETQGRRGTFVRSRAVEDDDDRAALAEATGAFVDAARRAGLSRDEAQRLVEQRWPR